ncbi:intermembrane transport protein PqiB [Oceanospirillum sediminis]|uniref:Intermembrane transport protein PqiB n=1 Tax=Oceanospirillum sediminis TaxID=2760088 RepID=A0A839ISZ7_9GAMM|nr:intermembrane transport protein PqiB [Oceanospirillum sediminis]MBB1487784.1 intermembrane transport protein PqiB [Oceanospirillum sediminis]
MSKTDSEQSGLSPDSGNGNNIPHIPVISRKRSVSAIWLLPLIALAISGWMAWQDWANRGSLISISFMTADGIDVGKTRIRVRSVDVGKVESVSLMDGDQGVIVYARIEPEAAELLHEDTRFWVVRPRIGASGISGLNTLLSGAYIEMKPGNLGQGLDEYTGLEEPPVNSVLEPGLRVRLFSNEAHSLNVGDQVLFRGFPVGQIEWIQFEPESVEAIYGVFIRRPYDQLVTSDSRFWNVSGVHFNLSAEGVNIQTGSLDTMISGGITFDTLDPDKEGKGKIAENGDRFRLHPDFKSVRERPYNYSMEYLLLFEQSVRGLVKGAPVEFRGVRIGTVDRILFQLAEDEKQGDPRVPVVIKLEPGRLGMPDDEASLPHVRRQLVYWISRGLRASLKQASLITGSLYVDMDLYPDAPVATVVQSKGYNIIPSVSGGFAQIETKLLSVLTKIEQLQIEPLLSQAGQTLTQAERAMTQARQTLVTGEQAISQLNETLAKFDKLADNPDTQALPAEIKNLLQELRLTVRGLSPDSRLYTEVNRTMHTLQQTMLKLQPVLETLNKKSNALVFEAPKGPDIIPGGQP